MNTWTCSNGHASSPGISKCRQCDEPRPRDFAINTGDRDPYMVQGGQARMEHVPDRTTEHPPGLDTALKQERFVRPEDENFIESLKDKMNKKPGK